MKKLFLSISLLALGLTGFAQDFEKTLELRAQQMVDYTVAANYEELLGMTYPKVFDAIPYETMLAGMKEFASGDDYSVAVIKTVPNFSFGKIKETNLTYYTVFEHDVKMHMAMKNDISDEEAAKMAENLKAAIGTDQVAYDPASKTFEISKRSKVLAILDESTGKEWKFIPLDGSPLAGQVVPDFIRNDLGL